MKNTLFMSFRNFPFILKSWKGRLNFLSFSQIFLKIFLFSFPFQIHGIVFKSQNFFSGNFNSFLSFSLYFSEICLLFSIVFFSIFFIQQNFFYQKKEYNFTYPPKNFTFLLLLFHFYLIISSIFSSNPLLSFLSSLRHLEFFGLYLLISMKVLDLRQILKFLSLGISFQIILGFLQYFKQSSVGLSFLGESNLGVSSLGTAKLHIEHTTIIRPYGTFPHANVFGGAIFMMLGLSFLKNKRQSLKSFIWFVFLSLGLILTFSRTAFFAFLIFLICYFSLTKIKFDLKYGGVIVSFLFFFIICFNLQSPLLSRFLNWNDQSMAERIIYMDTSIEIFKKNWWGTGLSTFTLQMDDFSPEKLLPWNYQPVHNIFLLIVTETGIIGFIFLIALFGMIFFHLSKIIKNRDYSSEKKYRAKVFLSIGIGFLWLGFFDHYLLTLFSGLCLFYLFISLISYLFVEE